MFVSKCLVSRILLFETIRADIARAPDFVRLWLSPTECSGMWTNNNTYISALPAALLIKFGILIVRVMAYRNTSLRQRLIRKAFKDYNIGRTVLINRIKRSHLIHPLLLISDNFLRHSKLFLRAWLVFREAAILLCQADPFFSKLPKYWLR